MMQAVVTPQLTLPPMQNASLKPPPSADAWLALNPVLVLLLQSAPLVSSAPLVLHLWLHTLSEHATILNAWPETPTALPSPRHATTLTVSALTCLALLPTMPHARLRSAIWLPYLMYAQLA